MAGLALEEDPLQILTPETVGAESWACSTPPAPRGCSPCERTWGEQQLSPPTCTAAEQETPNYPGH